MSKRLTTGTTASTEKRGRRPVGKGRIAMQLYPSMMCADYSNLGREVRELDAAGADSFHCDVMDAAFVPNMTMGLMDIRAVRANTSKPLDVHLMIEDPLDKIGLFVDAGADTIYIHPESERFVAKALISIREKGCKAGLAIDPDTPLSAIEEVLPLVDAVMVMTVNPGFAGQAFLDFTLDKVKRLAALKSAYGFTLVIDGACSPERIAQLANLGADAFVLGTSALFGKGDYAQSMECLRALKDDEQPLALTA